MKLQCTTSKQTLVRILFLSLVLQQTVFLAHGQRLKEGCFDAEPITCDTPYESNDIDVNVEQICRQIIREVLPQDDAFLLFQQEQHADYLNSIEASTELCSQIRVAYPQCIFCTKDPSFLDLAKNVALVTACAGRPTLDQVLQDEEGFPDFETQADIWATCQELETAYDQGPLLAGVAMPSTIHLNLRQIQIKHLCPGNCEGGCFDEDLYPPSCDPAAFKGVRDDSLDVFAICDELTYYGFYYDTRVETIMNTSRHVDYLRYFSGNTTFCDQARQSYSSCLWCAESLCFEQEASRPTCEAPTFEIMTTTNLDVNAVCQGIYHYFADMTFPDDLYNYAKHATHFLLGDNHPFCDHARQAYHSCYWCAPNVPLHFCASGLHCDMNITLPTNFNSSTLAALGISDQQSTVDCDAIYQQWTTTHQEPFTIQGCYEDIFLADRCGAQFCALEQASKFNTTDYLGATTEKQKKALVWISRVSAFFSFCGACFILQDILKDPKLRTLTYHQLLVAMATFDVVTAFAWAFATAPIPADEGWYIEGAQGTNVTCKIQAFFVQLGFTSVFYNVSLAAYYVLVVVYSWKEFQLLEMKMHFHILPMLLGFGMAFAAIPLFGWFEYGCHVTPASDLWGIVVFVVFPLASSILFITVCLLMVYFKVRGQAAASKKWSFSVGKASQLEQAVFWQCVSYGLAFYISWPILFSVYLGNVDKDGPYGLAVAVSLLAPLQGFNNFLVYIRPKLSVKKQKKKPKSGGGSSSASQSSGSGSGSSNPFSRLMRMVSRRPNVVGGSNGFSSAWGDSQRSVAVLDPSAAIAQAGQGSGTASGWNFFGSKRQVTRPSTKPSTANSKPSEEAMAKWGLQQPATTSKPSTAAMAQWGLQETVPTATKPNDGEDMRYTVPTQEQFRPVERMEEPGEETSTNDERIESSLRLEKPSAEIAGAVEKDEEAIGTAATEDTQESKEEAPDQKAEHSVSLTIENGGSNTTDSTITNSNADDAMQKDAEPKGEEP